MEEQTITRASRDSVVEKVAFWILTGMVALLPFFFIPSDGVSFATAKGLLVSIGVITALALYIISIIKDARVHFPKNLLSLSLVLVPVTFLLSAIFTGAHHVSLIGYSFETGTVAFVFFAVVLALLVGQLFKKKERAFYAYIAIVVSFAVVALFQIIRFFFGADVLSFGVFTNTVSNLVGNWNDLGLFFGATALLSLVSLEMMDLKRLYKTIAYVMFVASLFILAVVNFITVWYVLGALALVFFLFLVSFDRFLPSKNPMDTESHPHSSMRKISWNSLAVLLISLAFIFFGGALGQKIAETFDVASVEVRPAFGTTMTVLGGALKDNPLFGVGPNRFTEAWLMYRPSSVNETLFWNTDFSSGIGIVPTLIGTTGIVGLLALLFFFVMYVKAGFKAMFNQSEDSFSRYLTTSAFIVSLFFWIMSFVYVPSIVNVILTFFFTGLFIASLYRENALKEEVFSLEHHPKISFVSVLVLVVLLIANVSLGYLLVQKSVALGYFQKSVVLAQEGGDLTQVEAGMIRAIQIGGYDLYYRGLSELNLIQVNQILSEEGATPESVRDRFQITIANSIENARAATSVNPRNYMNWIALGRVYAALVPEPFAIPGAYDNAKKTYEEAQKVNPKSPLIPILLARLEVSNGNLNGARDYANAAIALKSNYADAHFLIAQIEATQGNIDKAIPALETTLLLSPQNPGLFFQLGLLKYNDRDWNGAVEAFSRAIQLVPEYANAKYFRGLSYVRIGDTEKAILDFTELKETNPDNEEVDAILTNLRENQDPFAGTEAPITNRPERRPEPPIQDQN